VGHLAPHRMARGKKHFHLPFPHGNEYTSSMKGRDLTDNNTEIYRGENKSRRRIRIVGHCAQCGFPVFEGSDAFSVIKSGDVVHPECFDEYIDEHLFDFVEKIPSE
jgi:hypothetical protein